MRRIIQHKELLYPTTEFRSNVERKFTSDQRTSAERFHCTSIEESAKISTSRAAKHKCLVMNLGGRQDI